MSDQDGTETDIVTEALSAGTFSFAEVVQGRGYPQDTVVLYQDEATAYERVKYLDSVLEARGDNSHEMLIAGAKQDSAKRAAYKRAIDDDPEVAAKIAEFDAKLAASAYTFHIQGLSEDIEKTLLDKARAEFPPEFERWKNPMNGKPEKQELPSPERDRYFTNLVWSAHITKIVNPKGQTDVAPGLPAAEAIRKMPSAMQLKFNQAINKLSVASAAFESAAESPDFS